MAIEITAEPTSPTAKVDFVRVTVTGADQNTLTGYDGDELSTMPGTPEQYPASPENRYYLTFELGGEIKGKSYVFSVNSDGEHVFPNYLFPEAGSWTMRLSKASDDSSVKTQAITVA